MKKTNLRTLLFLALCCDLGLFSKRLISPFTNIITDALHIPGGIGTSFSLMFLVIAAMLAPNHFCGTVMGAVQCVLAVSLGMVGSMGALSPVGYIVPGIVIDIVLKEAERARLPKTDRMLLANGLGAVSASLTANLIVFRLKGPPLVLYFCVALLSGSFCGILGAQIVKRLYPVIDIKYTKKRERQYEKEIV